MKQDLLAPPKLKPRGFAAGLGAMMALPVAGAVWFTLAGHWSVLETGWRLAVLLSLWAAAVYGYARLIRYSHRIRPERMVYTHIAVGLSSFAMMAVAVRVMLGGTAIASGMNFWFMVPMMAGMFLVSGGLVRRVGESLHCPKCEYEFAFSEGLAPDRCPECATEWIGKLNKGRRTRSARMVAAGVAIALFGFVVFQPIIWLSPVAKFLPTPVLYAALYAEPQGFMSTWDELGSRPLGARWIEVMGNRVIAYRNRNQHGYAGGSWFSAMAKAGKMPAEVVDRANREAFCAELVTPASARAGVPFEVRLRVSRAADGFGSSLGVMFGGYSIDGAEPMGRGGTAWGYQLRPGGFSIRRDAYERRLIITQPGEHRIKVAYWVIIQPTFSEILWGPDRAPLKPAGAMWFQKVEEERTIRVR